MEEITLNDLLRFTDEELSNTRIRFNMNNGIDDPLKIFLKKPEELLNWNYWNSKTYRKGQISIGLVRLSNDEWLLFTIGKIVETIKLNKNTGVGARAEEIEEYKKYFGRVIVKYHNQSRQNFRVGSQIIKELKISRILESKYKGTEFPGYEKVSLMYEDLEQVVSGRDASYRNALSKQKAVYVLTDTYTGKLYIGSSTSEKGMLLDRWKSYINTCTGNNKQLIELTNNEGPEYFKKYFQFTILEHFDLTVSDNYILERESYWKKAFRCKGELGYNSN